MKKKKEVLKKGDQLREPGVIDAGKKRGNGVRAFDH